MVKTKRKYLKTKRNKTKRNKTKKIGGHKFRSRSRLRDLRKNYVNNQHKNYDDLYVNKNYDDFYDNYDDPYDNSIELDPLKPSYKYGFNTQKLNTDDNVKSPNTVEL